MDNKGTFLKSSFNLNGTFVQMLHFQPSFPRKPVSIRYEVSGTDGLIHEGENKIIESNTKKNIITFECKFGETYFCKVTGFFSESKSSNIQTIRLFYKVENDSDEIIGKNDSQKFGFKKIEDLGDQEDPEDPEDQEDSENQEDSDDDDDDDKDDDDDDDDNMTLEMRVKQLQEFSNYFSDE